ncbi:MAG: IPT/TIG domain-containing protein, partial [Gemmatimonadota bacterium]
MKRFIPYFALLAVVAFVGCTGNSPSAPAVPTVVPSAWNITTLSVSDANPFIGSPVFVQAVVTRDGVAAPDGTAVDFKSSGPGTLFGFTSGDLTKGSFTLSKDGTVLTENGTASVFFLAADDPQDSNDTPAGTYLIQARVQNVTKQVNVTYNDFLVPDQPQLLDVNPRRGSYDGGEIVDIVGRRIEAPVDVFFDVEGAAYQAVLLSMVDFCLDGNTPPSCNNNPDQLAQRLTVQTPAFTGLDTSIDRAADIRVISGSGTGFQQTAGLTQIYVLVRAQGAVIYGVSPNSGRSSGGEIVNVLGQGFGSVASDLGVTFIDEHRVGRLGTVLAVSPDGAQIQVETPLFSTTPLDKDRLQDVQVSTPTGVVTLADSFVVLADNPQPKITSISPTAGPLDGGTLVTIFGQGFQAPMQVFFGDLTALDVNVFNDTTPGDNDRITCVTPDYSQQGDVPPVTVNVRVRNMESGKEHTLAAAFRYGDKLYISGNSPSQGQRGDLVLIFGSGFEDPLQVFFPENSAQQMEVVSVTGTELVVRVPDNLPPSCADTASRFKVRMIETNNEVVGGNFTILGNAPL